MAHDCPSAYPAPSTTPRISPNSVLLPPRVLCVNLCNLYFPPGYWLISISLTNENNAYSQFTEGLFNSTYTPSLWRYQKARTSTYSIVLRHQGQELRHGLQQQPRPRNYHSPRLPTSHPCQLAPHSFYLFRYASAFRTWTTLFSCSPNTTPFICWQ